MGNGLGTFGGFGVGAAVTAPTQPNLAVTLTGATTAIATITGQAGATHVLQYKTLQASEWTFSVVRVNDGDIVVVNLSPGVTYNFIVHSEDGDANSEPSIVVTIEVPQTSSDNIFDTMDIASVDMFLNTFAEQVTYHPAGGGDRVIDAIVTRENVRQVTAGRTPFAEIIFKNDASDGISAAESDSGGDAITYAPRQGGPASRRSLGGVISQNAGTIVREVF